MTLSANERRRLADYLSQYAHEVVEEWMRIVEVDEDVPAPGSARFTARARWAGDGTFTLSESGYGDECGTYRLIVKVEPIDVPPIGPENDPAMRYELSWVDKTMDDVRAGDRIELRGTEAVVETAYRNGWHVHPASRYEVVRLEHNDVAMRLEGRPDKVSVFRPDVPVKIHLTDHEIAALDAMGWENRVCVITEQTNALKS